MLDGSTAARHYHKPTWTGQYLHFYSFVPLPMKRNLVRNLYKRVKRIASPMFLESDLDLLRSTLLSNCYPVSFITENFADNQAPRNVPAPSEQKRVVLRIQFKGDAIAEVFKRKVNGSVERNCENIYPVIVFTSRALVQTQAKDRLPVMTTSNIVYTYTCSTCQSQYVGMTTRRLEDRVKEHVPRWINVQSDRAAKSSIAQHILDTGHAYQPESFTTLYKVRNSRILKFYEAVAIKHFRPKLNVQQDFDYGLKLRFR